MKAIINGTIYDTTRAKYIDGYTVKASRLESLEIMEYLYCTPTGEYFTGRFGGSRTEYAEGVLTPLTTEGLRQWAQAHMKQADIDRLLPHLREPKPAQGGFQFTVAVTEESLQRLFSLAALYAPSLSGALGEVVSKGINSGHGCVRVI